MTKKARKARKARSKSSQERPSQSLQESRHELLKALDELRKTVKTKNAENEDLALLFRGLKSLLKEHSRLAPDAGVDEIEALSNQTNLSWKAIFEVIPEGIWQELESEFRIFSKIGSAFERARLRKRERAKKSTRSVEDEDVFWKRLHGETEYFNRHLYQRLTLTINALAWESLLFSQKGLSIGAFREWNQALNTYLISQSDEDISIGRLGKPPTLNKEEIRQQVKAQIWIEYQKTNNPKKVTREIIAAHFDLTPEALAERLGEKKVRVNWRTFRAEAIEEFSKIIPKREA